MFLPMVGRYHDEPQPEPCKNGTLKSMPDDIRARLRTADTLLRQHRYPEAIAIYEGVAAEYLAQGFAQRAVAVAKQVLFICDNHLLAQSTVAHRILVDGYLALGLDTEAEAAKERLAKLEPQG